MKARPSWKDATRSDELLVTAFLMRLAREWDLRFENLLRTGAVGKWYSSVGNEALTVCSALALRPGDGLVTLHRDVGAILARSIDARALLDDILGRGRGDAAARRRAGEARDFLYRLACQMLGKRDGFTGGFERSYHFGRFDEATGLIHVGMISHLGAMIPVAAGVALAQSFRGESAVTLNFIGEGGTSTGDFHEGLNMAAVWKLPLVLIIENNHWAFSTPESEQYACASLSDRAAGYGIAGCSIDGCDAFEVRRVIDEAVDRARRGEGPTLVEARLGRLRGHAEADGSLDIVPAPQRAAYVEADPMPRLERALAAERIVEAALLEEIAARVRELLVDVIDRARASAGPDPARDIATRTVFAPADEFVETASGDATEEATMVDAISRGLREEMRRDPSVVLMGQDIAELGGAFRVTGGFLAEFGRQRVRNTPIAESGTLGIAAGAALLGLRPVVEMQFADFISCGFNQVVNVIAKTYFRWRRPVPLVVRCPSGGGAGAGPFHAQNPEAWFTHTPGLKVVAPAFPRDALGLIKAAIRDPNPVLFLEHKHLYRRVRERLPDGEVLVPIGRARIVRPGDDVTAIAYGWMVHRAVEAAALLEREGISVEVVDLRSLIPFDRELLGESIARTSRALVAHEATLTCGFGAEIAAWIADELFDQLDAPVSRVAFPDIPVPYESTLEAACIPDPARIAVVLKKLVEY